MAGRLRMVGPSIGALLEAVGKSEDEALSERYGGEGASGSAAETVYKTIGRTITISGRCDHLSQRMPAQDATSLPVFRACPLRSSPIYSLRMHTSTLRRCKRSLSDGESMMMSRQRPVTGHCIAAVWTCEGVQDTAARNTRGTLASSHDGAQSSAGLRRSAPAEAAERGARVSCATRGGRQVMSGQRVNAARQAPRAADGGVAARGESPSLFTCALGLIARPHRLEVQSKRSTPPCRPNHATHTRRIVLASPCAVGRRPAAARTAPQRAYANTGAPRCACSHRSMLARSCRCAVRYLCGRGSLVMGDVLRPMESHCSIAPRS